MEEKTQKVKTQSKKNIESTKLVDKNRFYTITEAVELAQKVSYTKFDGTLEFHATLRRALSVNVNLPHAGGKAKKVEVADESTLEKLGKGKIDFDILLATADFMPKLVPFAKLLGPRGMMPNPKNKTLIKSKDEASAFNANSMTIKTEKEVQNLHAPVGKLSQPTSELEANLKAVIDAVGARLITRAFVSPTMGPSIKLQIATN